MIADVVDNDAWRIWPQGREELMLDKQLYRNLPDVTPADLAQIRANYEQVAEIVGTFPQMRPGMVADPGRRAASSASAPATSRTRWARSACRRCGTSSRPRARPGYVLQLVTQLDATFARLLFVTVGSGDGALAGMVEYASATPVVRAPAAADLDLVALQCAKAFSLEDTVVFGRVLLVQANARSAVLPADAELERPAAGNGNARVA